jgi:hypothetical protein
VGGFGGQRQPPAAKQVLPINLYRAMPEKIIKKQYTPNSAYTKAEAAMLKAQVAVLMARYGYFMQNAATITNIPLVVFQSIIAIENGTHLDVNYVSSAGAVGLTQITPNTATDTLIRTKKANRLTQPETELLLKKGIDVNRLNGNAPKLKNGKSQKWYSSSEGSIVTTDQLKDVELNLLLGAIYLSEQMIRFTEITIKGFELRMDKVIVAYNQGFNYKVPMGTTAHIIAKVPVESKNYIAKMTGVNGMLETLSAA